VGELGGTSISVAVWVGVPILRKGVALPEGCTPGVGVGELDGTKGTVNEGEGVERGGGASQRAITPKA